MMLFPQSKCCWLMSKTVWRWNTTGFNDEISVRPQNRSFAFPHFKCHKIPDDNEKHALSFSIECQ